MKLGCCYYPEHWPEENWINDAQRMVDMGLSLVRIGEFSWSRIEPEDGRFDWAWLDKAVETLGDAGLSIIMGTPTATPPKWLVDKMPDMLAIDVNGNPRNFGSRRHYCFSHRGYRKECERIVSAMAKRYGNHPAIHAWQTDNEYGCHDTTVSYSKASANAFRKWLKNKYTSVDALNIAWGNVFWSMEYNSFDEIDLPLLTVTESNPAHRLDFRRFASDEVRSFNMLQVDILREYARDRDIIHNFMGFVTDFDHHDVGADIDVASWDSYPLGFLEQYFFDDEDKHNYARQGHPDIAAFHHDLYRGCSNGRWSVMEQQPGPVNWARWNPSPLKGMVQLWTMEAAAHGAEFCSFFRWRQAAFAQEQMHAGLLRPDGEVVQGGIEAAEAARELKALAENDLAITKAPVALLFSYEADWLFQTQPQGEDFKYIELAFNMYSALRQLGLNVDIISPDADLNGYQMIVAPSLPILKSNVLDSLARQDVPIFFGPRSGSKTENFQIPDNLQPADLQQHLPIKIARVESLRPALTQKCGDYKITRWIEEIESDLEAVLSSDTGQGILYRNGNFEYLGVWPCNDMLVDIFKAMAQRVDIGTQELPDGVRVRQSEKLIFIFNYNSTAVDVSYLISKQADIVNDAVLKPASYMIVKR